MVGSNGHLHDPEPCANGQAYRHHEYQPPARITYAGRVWRLVKESGDAAVGGVK